MEAYYVIDYDGLHTSPTIDIPEGLNKEQAVISPGDVLTVAPGLERSLSPSRRNHASIFRVRKTDDQAGPTINFP